MITQYYPDRVVTSDFEGEAVLNDRPTWIQFYMGLAFAASQRSPDAQTKHGCFIVDQFWRPISFGYNGFMRGLPDHLIPNTRPGKYKFIKDHHAERNALDNATVDLLNLTGTKAFVTGEPCAGCLSALLSHGILEIYAAEGRGYEGQEAERKIKDFYLRVRGAKLYQVSVDEVNWLSQIKI
jgi:deoxycytidylate deaminase